MHSCRNRNALYENGRESTTLTVNELNARTGGAFIALYERAVGFYATLVNVNAYHQPGVEAGKNMAGTLVALQKEVLTFLQKNKGTNVYCRRLSSAYRGN